jgi:hypothetical protein
MALIASESSNAARFIDAAGINPQPFEAVCQSLHAAPLYLDETCTVSVPPSLKILI